MKKFLNLFLIFVFTILCCGAIVMPTAFSHADNNVYEINSYEQLGQYYSLYYNDPNATLKLMQDLDFSNEEPFEIPDTIVFRATFDGNGHQVKIASVNKTENGLFYGLFPRANGATIKNLKVFGDLTYDFSDQISDEVYAGVLIGDAENVTIENCELGITSVLNEETQQKETVYSKATFTAYSNVNFGAFAGRLKGNNNIDTQNIYNSVSYYNVDTIMARNVTLNIGGIAGVVEQGNVLNTLSFGNVQISSVLTSTGGVDKNQNLGGVAGYALGTNSVIKNSCFGGKITVDSENNIGLNTAVGAIIGRASTTSTPSADYVNFDYWTKTGLQSVGQGLTLASEKVSRIELINKNFLSDQNNFDSASPAWDFDNIWTMRDSNLHLQHFLTFSFSFANILDVTQVLQTANFQVNENGEFIDSDGKNIKYGETIKIKLTLKPQYNKFYSLTSVILNSNGLDIDLSGTKQEDGGYLIPIVVSDLTDGIYSFVMNADVFNCVVTVANEEQGGVKTTDATSSVKEMNLSFSYNSSTKRISAVGSGIYTFDYWKLYYKEGEQWIESELEEENEHYKYDNPLKIAFGSQPFDREFKLEAYFTSEKAVELRFPSYSDIKIQSLKVGGEDYNGESIRVSPNATVNIEIITQKGYKLNYTKFLADMKLQYGENALTMISDPTENEETYQTTYKFNLYMRNRSDLENKEMELPFSVEREKSSGSGLAWWVYLLISVGVVAVISAVVVIIVKKFGGRRGGGTKVSKVASKKTNYDDYYI